MSGLAFSADKGWIQIRRSDGLIGWCSAAYSTPYSGSVPTPTPPTVSAYYQVTATALNIRSGPGTSNPVIGTLTQNAIVSGLTLSADGGWIEIRRSDGIIGWCSAAYFDSLQRDGSDAHANPFSYADPHPDAYPCSYSNTKSGIRLCIINRNWSSQYDSARITNRSLNRQNSLSPHKPDSSKRLMLS